MAIVIAEVQIEGIRPLMFHVFGPDSIPLEKRERTGVAGNDPEEWRKTYTALPSGQLYIRPDYAFSCLTNAARNTKHGSRGNYMAKLAGTLQITDDVLLMDRWMPPEPLPTDPTEPVYLDIRSTRNPATKGRGVRYRVAICPGWHLNFHAQFEGTVVSRTIFRTILIDAGALVGLADGRALGFGRFEIVSCEFSDNGEDTE